MNVSLKLGSSIFFQTMLILLLVSCSVTSKKSIRIIETTDLHGVILPYDFIDKEKLKVSMASGYTCINQIRNDKCITFLLDNGDNLQGQPEVYFYNYIDTVSPHFFAEVMNYMSYDAGTVGNHDIEAGHAVYDRLVREYNFPLLAANAVEIKTGKPYFRAYQVIEKDGIKIAVLGLITPAVPNWLPPQLYSGIEFKDMVETAEKWMPVIKKEKPDLIVGLFHSGWDRDDIEMPEHNNYRENSSAAVAYNVPGFNVIFTGHDHKPANEKFVNSSGDTILILNGGSRSENLAVADIIVNSKKLKGVKQLKMTGKIINVADFDPDPDFIRKFESNYRVIDDYVNKVIGNSLKAISTRDSYFGPSSFVDMIHSIQLDITGADISFAAPLSFDVKIDKGPITVGDMFKLYRFENMLYTMSLSGAEIKKYLEFSYGGWFSTMAGPNDLLLNLQTGKDGKPLITNERARFRNQLYNFDSAAGINYTVDVSKPEGSRIEIMGFTDGRPFEFDKMYKVAVNSYRGNGGGGHFTEGAGITKDELRNRLLASTDRDLRYYILKLIEAKKVIDPQPLNCWKIIPENWVRSAKTLEYSLLFGKDN